MHARRIGYEALLLSRHQTADHKVDRLLVQVCDIAMAQWMPHLRAVAEKLATARREARMRRCSTIERQRLLRVAAQARAGARFILCRCTKSVRDSRQRLGASFEVLRAADPGAGGLPHPTERTGALDSRSRGDMCGGGADDGACRPQWRHPIMSKLCDIPVGARAGRSAGGPALTALACGPLELLAPCPRRPIACRAPCVHCHCSPPDFPGGRKERPMGRKC